ncbi:MAG: M20/M25/M40 family metallo-hydrolase [Bacteroidetes bacterium]|nr:M20/M25/M40 family metallo-hydrolase [Bacteroidota bacterium]
MLHFQRVPILFFLFVVVCLLFPIQPASAQNQDSLIIRKIYSEALSNPVAYKNLEYLCTKIGGRICGSPQAEKAVFWVKGVLDKMGLDTVFLQEMKVVHWVRGKQETAYSVSKKTGKHPFHVCALGGSIGTGEKGVIAAIVEVSDYEELARIGKEKITGKIVFFNHPADPTFISTFGSYGSSVPYRATGAMQAARYGAVGVVVRSATPVHDENPHTGIMHYSDTVMKIPAIAISTNDADRLSEQMKKDPGLTFFMRTTCKDLPEVKSYNIIGEIRGTEHPGEIIDFGGHLDSWELGEGAHDDGSGVVQTIEVLRLYKTLGIRPKHSIRVIVFMDEEIAQRGAKRYALYVKNELNHEKHLAAIECDRGGDTPQGFSIDATDTQVQKVQGWKKLLLPYGLWSIEKGGSGVDIHDLKTFGIPLIGLVTDSQRYFDYHHSAADKYSTVNPRELQLGAAAVAALVVLIDTYGL